MKFEKWFDKFIKKTSEGYIGYMWLAKEAWDARQGEIDKLKQEHEKRNKIINQLQLYLIETMSWDDCDRGCSDYKHTTACDKRSTLKLKIKDYLKQIKEVM